MSFISRENLGLKFQAVIGPAAVAVVTVLLIPFRELLNPTAIAMILLLVVLVSSALLGSLPGFLTSVLGILCLNFFFLPPYYTFTITAQEHWTAYIAFIITALVAGQLSSYGRRRAEESEAKQKEIERLYDELRAAFEQASEAEALRRSEKLKSALLDAVTHDLRTPLTSIKASVTSLIDDAKASILDDDLRREFLDIINEETDRLDEFIEGMVGMAKIEANALQLNRRPAAFEEIVSNAVERASRQLKDHELTIDIAADLPNVFADASSISEVVYTLLDNAANYSPEGSRIKVVAAAVTPNEIELSVQDQGKGIEPALRERVFDKFFRAGETDIHQTGSGLGLGLAIARGIVESQGGHIRIADADEGFVTKFVVTLPISEDGVDKAEA